MIDAATDKRVAQLPGVPTGEEAGVRGFKVPLWYGMFAPAGTPSDVVARLSRELKKALELPEVRERLAALSIEPWGGTSEELRDLLRADIERYGEIVQAAGLKLQ